MTNPGVHLRIVDEDNVRAAWRLEMEPGQERFGAPVAVSLAQAYVETDEAWPRLVYDGDELVGFVMALFDESENDCHLWRLNIAAGHQRKGYGSFAVLQVARESKRRGGRELNTSYVPGDGSPEGFYERLGFTPTGEMDGDEVVIRLSLDAIDA